MTDAAYLIPGERMPGANPIYFHPYEGWEMDLYYFLACVHHKIDSKRGDETYDRLIGLIQS